MTTIKRIALPIAKFLKRFEAPHLLKFVFFQFIKNRNIRTVSMLEISNASVNLDLGNFIEYWIYMDGLYEKKWIKAVRRLVRNKVFIDVGANIGMYSLALFREAQYIYAFEPETKNYNNLVRNLKHAGAKNIRAINKAVSGSNKRLAKLFINEKDRGWHSLYLKGSGKTQLIDTLTLDSFIKKYRVNNIGLIKIDVEGAEIDVLRGSYKTISKYHPPILVEINRPRLEKSGFRPRDLYEPLTTLGYSYFSVDENGRISRPKRSSLEDIYNQNVLFLYGS